MSGRILIIDSVPTNRIVLKVKMHAARYTADACASMAEAAAIMAENRPDLIMINLSDPVEDRHSFCKSLKSNADTADIAIIAVGVADTSRARFAALDAGADEVMPRPTSDTLLLARVRSLLRRRHADAEIWMRDGTSHALGFEEKGASFIPAAKVALLSTEQVAPSLLSALLSQIVRGDLQHLTPDGVLAGADIPSTTDLFVIDAAAVADNGKDLFRLISDLRTRAETRLAAQLVLFPDNMPDIAALALDLGADDVVPSSVAKEELSLRLNALSMRKHEQDRMRDTVRNGLHAAVTDPLTGLYNRRYAEPYLIRMAEQSHALGQELAVMMIDIDHFKTINDTYGHAAGDQVLIELARRLRENLRSIDLVARIGGEEFLVALPQTDADQASMTANRLRRLVNGEPFSLSPGQPRLRVTISVGVAMGTGVGWETQSMQQMCVEADAALYAAKNGGRDNVQIARTAA